MDSSLTRCPELRSLDLSRNNVQEVANLHLCPALTRLVLDHNHISDVHSLPASASRLRELSLQVGPLRPALHPAWEQPVLCARSGHQLLAGQAQHGIFASCVLL